MGKEEGIRLEGQIIAVEKNFWKVQIDGDEGQPTDHIVTAHLGGRLRKNYIRLVMGDRVTVEVSPYDLSKGRIVYRQK